MKPLFLRTAAWGLMGLLAEASALALPAKPGLINAQQPDGSVITIRLEGNEYSHRAFTSDGYLLLNDAEGYYVFADCDSDGFLIATDIREINPESRSASTLNKLASINREKIATASARKTRADVPARNPGLVTNPFPSKGENKSIAILVEFKNKKFSIENPNDYYTRMLNEEGFSDFGATGSARDYFVENSNGLFKPYFDVYGPVQLDKSYSYYGGNDANGNEVNCWRMVVDGCLLLDDEVDFSQYDANEDGMIDNVYVFYAGYGEADGGNPNTVWPHSWEVGNASTEQFIFDGVRLNHYACSNELQYMGNLPDGIGSFVHEFGHVIGFPDLYITSYGEAFTPGKWDVMDRGSYNNNSYTPPSYSAYERYALEWMEPEILNEPGEYELRDIQETNHAYLIETENPDEFYLLENRQQTGNDTYIPGHGMLVWHIDFDQKIWNSNIVNNTASHQYVDIVEADNKQNEATRNGDSFPGKSKVTSFTAETTPALLSWAGRKLAVELYEITESEDGIITFVAEGEGTGVSLTERENGFIKVSGNTICCNDGIAKVYDLSGREVASAGTLPVTLPAGIYIAMQNGKTVKISIK